MSARSGHRPFQAIDADAAIGALEAAMLEHAYQYEQWAENGTDEDDREGQMAYHLLRLSHLTNALGCLVGNPQALEHRSLATRRAVTRVCGA